MAMEIKSRIRGKVGEEKGRSVVVRAIWTLFALGLLAVTVLGLSRTVFVGTIPLSAELPPLVVVKEFDTQRIRHIQLSDRVYPKEGFHLLSFTALVTAEEYLIVGAPTNRVRRFERGAPYMYFDTPKVNFGAPDTEKTLCEIHIHSESETPFTTQVFYSLDDGANWTFITTVSVSRDSMAFVHPWITSNEFMVRFAGHGLHIHSYALFARPTGRLAKQN